MFATRRQTLQDRFGNRWAVELLQIYHMPIMRIDQGWHLIDICINEETALKRREELKQEIEAECKLRVRELTNAEEEEIP